MLYDFTKTQHIDIARLPGIDYIQEFEYQHRGYVPGYAGGCRFSCRCASGQTIDLAINGTSFMGHIRGSAAYFVGTIRGSSIYIFDREESAHVNFRISGCILDSDDASGICTFCWLTKQG